MSARPLSTFQSEGWYRPSTARSQHYYRPPVEDTMNLGPESVVTLCGRYGHGGGIRPWLTPHPLNRAKRCARCDHIVTAQLMQPSDAPWFPESLPTSGAD